MNSKIGKEEFALDPGDTGHLYVNGLHRLPRPREENWSSSWRHASYLLLKSYLWMIIVDSAAPRGVAPGRSYRRFWGDLEG